jgi:drug/metabolite transporter superfamily protein YnfA
VTTNLAFLAAAMFFEIAGCFAFWMWLRRGVTPFVALLGMASLPQVKSERRCKESLATMQAPRQL